MALSYIKIGRRWLAVLQEEKGIYAQAVWPVIGSVIFLTHEKWMSCLAGLPK
jgi:hypothetical protein